MKRIAVPVAALLALAVPTTAFAAPPSKADRKEAKKECLALKSAAKTKANLASLVRAEGAKGVTTKNAFGKCVSERASDARSERVEARKAAFAECREQYKPGSQRGKPASGQERNAFGKCISLAAKAHRAESDQEQREESLNPAKTCRALQTGTDEQKAEYATYRNFGHCVSSKAKAQQDDQPTQPAAPQS